MKIRHAHALKGTVKIPGDKSISHRAIMFGSIAEGKTEITNFLQGADCLSTISCFQKLGIEIEKKSSSIIVNGKGIYGLLAPSGVLDVGNSGTTARLISGILAGQKFSSSLTGDSSIQTRPMGRIITPLSKMGACIESLHNNGCVPLNFKGQALQAIHYDSPVASAQVKSAVLLAGLYADGRTSVTEPVLSRNHTELMLQAFGACISSVNCTASILSNPRLMGQKIEVPGDISSAAYFIAAALLIPGSQILVENVGINPTRDGMLTVLNHMGADITKEHIHTVSGEPVCDLVVRHSQLKAAEISGGLIPSLIDEIPVLSVLAAFAEGTTIIKDAAELKVKESDRIQTISENLSAMGAEAIPTEDGLIIHGGKPLHGAQLKSYADHRIAMAFTVAALCADEESTLYDTSCTSISYPSFFSDLQNLSEQKLFE